MRSGIALHTVQYSRGYYEWRYREVQGVGLVLGLRVIGENKHVVGLSRGHYDWDCQ